ncbi:MAG: 4Fe-4S dicluster domain-containing protein [Deltaproteobacteria bacterium]|nr:4Fe-4S dicluster domain-containing protein [Deltaproteobacteria bacterium]
MTREKRAKDLTYCTYCPKLCHFSCPVVEAEGRESATPTGKMTLAYLANRENRPLEQDAAAIIHRCLTCRQCTEFC